MATSAFKSTTKRTSIGAATSSSADDSGSSNRSSSAHHRRSRSLSRFSRPLPNFSESDAFDFNDNGVVPTPRGKFVNKTRGSGFPEISLDDLAIEFFDSSGDRGRSSGPRKSDAVSGASSASQRRGRSVSRQNSRVASGGDGRGSVCNNSGGGKVVSESNPRRRRSVSVVRYQISDSESDLDHSQNSSTINRAKLKSFGSGSNQMPLSHRPAVSNQRQVLRRSFSQKDLKSHDGYSSQSSVLTDDEGRDGHSSRSGIEKTIRAVYSQKAEHPSEDDVNGGLYAVMRSELRNAVEEIRMELGQAMVKTKTSDSESCLQSNDSDVVQAISSIRRNYSTKLEQSEKRKQDLLAKMVLEEQRGRELSKIVKEMLPDPKKKELLPDPKKNAVEKPARARKRSNDRNRMSKRLSEEAEKYIEDFISNVEDTDISSLDGERSDASSSLGVIVKPETLLSPAISNSRPVEMDGVVLPWLQWETSNDATPQSCKSKAEPPTTPNTLCNVVQEVYTAQDQSNRSTSSHGSWSPGIVNLSMSIEEDTGRKFGEPGSYHRIHSQSCSGESRGLLLDMDDYLKLQSSEDFFFERRKQKERINSGSLLLCNHMFF
ncbi:NKAP family protein CG6066 [Fagus crenata]